LLRTLTSTDENCQGLLSVFFFFKLSLHYGKTCSAFGLEAESINSGKEVRLESPQIRRFSVAVADSE